ncbi:MAG: Asp-tRNA(Asn)/Glu-tRNA(Gln) amidotransferase GatCAB subunit B, partial [Thermomicrobiales bacterium]
RDGMAELPADRHKRFMSDYLLSSGDAAVLTEERDVADYFEEVVRLTGGNAEESAKWVTGEVFAIARGRGGIREAGVDPQIVADVIKLVTDGEVTLRTAKEVFTQAVESGTAPATIVEERGLGQVSDADLIGSVAREVIGEHAEAVEDYRAGRTQAIGFLIGQSMRKLRGAGNPDVVREELIRILEEDSE